MWTPFKKLFGASKTLGSLLGDVTFETPPVQGQSSFSTFQWRVKKSLSEDSILVSLKLKPDGSIGADGSPMNYINFDLATAEQIKTDLDACIKEAHRQRSAATPVVTKR